MKLFLLTLAYFQVLLGQSYTPHFTITDNTQLLLSRDHLDVELGAVNKNGKSVQLKSGAEKLKDACKTDPSWSKDRVWSRLAHPHPLRSLSCRKEGDPSLHFTEYVENGVPVDEIHPDGYGPGMIHLNQFLYNRLFWRRNNQDAMHANILRAIERSQMPDAFITNHERTVLYLNNFGAGPVMSSVGNAFFRHYVHEFIWPSERHYEPMVNRVEGALFRHTVYSSLEYGIATWRHEDTRPKPSGEQAKGRRFKYALLHAFLAQTPTGFEPAYASIGALAGMSAISAAWHPWRVDNYAPNYTRRITLGVSGLVIKSLWAEFGPDIKKKALKKFHR